eukprot:753875-Hanusia_phi.AAC.8
MALVGVQQAVVIAPQAILPHHRVKNRFHDSSRYYEPLNAYRNISINLEVGWVFEDDQCKFLPVDEWDLKVAESHICELQMYEIVRGGAPALAV